MIETFVTYIRTRHFLGPELEKRYFRIFGDLEYDLLALKVETEVMALRIREVKRRATACIWISAEDERQISVTSHELNEHLYAKLELLHGRIVDAKSFRYDHERERQGWIIFNDIAEAIVGIADPHARSREQETLEVACEAYSRLDISELIDLHDRVQDLVAMARRDTMEPDEHGRWRERLGELYNRHPLRHAEVLASPEGISARMEMLKRKIDRQQGHLELAGMVYSAAVKMMRYRN
jgi:hypothetical protein